ncbi:hypothetical protein C7382_106123 [Porphyromonas loveana]|uniref:Uncharacterized protein n=1 Tax=Porphyromonas loveana TaxID=1884669 RepID=A0A2U1FHL4_9PORP|nr:hypothetical protein C7382_106123 [Porphyromonas loveana]
MLGAKTIKTKALLNKLTTSVRNKVINDSNKHKEGETYYKRIRLLPH